MFLLPWNFYMESHHLYIHCHSTAHLSLQHPQQGLMTLCSVSLFQENSWRLQTWPRKNSKPRPIPGGSIRSAVAFLSLLGDALVSVGPAVSLETADSGDESLCFVSLLTGQLLVSHRRPASAWEFARWLVMGDKVCLKRSGEKQEY